MARRSTQANAYAIDQISNFSGGLNTEDPVVIEDNELTQADNVVYTLQGRVTPRPGINQRYANDFATDPVVGLSPYYRTDGTSKLVIASGTNLYTDNPHLIYNYDSQSDWKNTDAKYNADLDTSPGDVVIPTVFTEDFSEGNFLRFKTADSGWTIDTSTGTKVAKGTGTQQKLIYELSSTQGYGSVYVKVVCQFAEANQRHFPVMFNTPSGTTVQAVVADSDGHFKYHNGTGLTTFPTDMVYTYGSWYTVEVWVLQGYLYVTINGLSVTPSGVSMKDTKNNSQTLVQQLQIQNADTTSATMWVSGVVVNPLAAVFTRATPAYKSDGTQVTANTPRYEAGYFGNAIMIEEGTTNLLTVNQANGGEDGTTIGFFANWGTTIFNTTEKYWQGSHSIKAVTQGVHEQEGVAVRIPVNKLQNGYTYTVSVYVCGTGTVQLAAGATNVTVGTYGYSSVVTLNNNWTRLSLTFIYDATKNPNNYDIGLVVITNIPEAITFYTDGWQLEAKPYATSFIDGTRAAESLTIPTAGVLNPQEGTVECRVYVPEFWQAGIPNWRRIWGIGRSVGAGMYVLRYDPASGKMVFEIYDNAGTAQNISVDKPSIGWHYFTTRWSASEMALFIDGVKVGYISNPSLPTNFADTVLSIGCRPDSPYDNINTLIDDLRISNRARTDTEIAAAYSSGLPLDWDDSTTYLLSFDGNLNLPANRQGYWMSPIVKCDSSIDYQTLRVSWTDTENVNSTLVALVVTSDDPSTLSWDTPYVLVNGELIDSTRLTLKQYVQIKFILQLINNGDSPVLHSATVTWGANPTVTLLKSGMSAASNYSFCQLMDKLVICNGVDVPKAYDGTTVTDITNAPRAYLTCVYKNRVFMAKTDQDRSSIWFSGIQDVTDWTSQDAGVIAVNPNDGDEIMAFLPTSTLLIIAKQRTCYYLQGYSPDTFQISVAGIGGTISPYGIIQTPYGIFRLDEDGVWATDFRKQVLITKKIQRIWDNLNHKIINKAALYYYKDNLLVSVAEAGSFYNNLLLVYDLIHKAWSVWRNLNASILTEFREYGEVHYLYGSSSSGNVFEIDGSSDSGAPVVGTITTKNFAYVTENFIKRAKWIDISFGNTNSNLNSNVTVTVLVDGTTTKTYQFTVPANTVSKTYRVYPPPFGSTIGVQLSLTGTAVLHSIAITYYPRVPRPQRIV